MRNTPALNKVLIALFFKNILATAVNNKIVPNTK